MGVVRPLKLGASNLPEEMSAADAVGSGSPITVLAISGGTVNVDLSLGDYFTLQLTADVTSLTFSNLPTGGRTICIDVFNDATGGHAFTLPANFHAIGNSDTAIQTAAFATTKIIATTSNSASTWDYSMAKVA